MFCCIGHIFPPLQWKPYDQRGGSPSFDAEFGFLSFVMLRLLHLVVCRQSDLHPILCGKLSLYDSPDNEFGLGKSGSRGSPGALVRKGVVSNLQIAYFFLFRILMSESVQEFLMLNPFY